MKEYSFKIKGSVYNVRVTSCENGKATAIVNDESFDVDFMDPSKSVENLIEEVNMANPDEPQISNQAVAGKTTIVKSPLPGKVLDIAVKPGDKVKAGQTLLCLEAMKMENNIYSEHTGIVKAVIAHKNDTVLEGDQLIEISY